MVRILTISLFIFSLLFFAINAEARSSVFVGVGPAPVIVPPPYGCYPPPPPVWVPAHWECTNINPYNGACCHWRWVHGYWSAAPVAYLPPPPPVIVGPPMYGPAFIGGFSFGGGGHHHRHHCR